MDRSAEEITEIERHKYFLSEKRGHDVGWEFAEGDWECQFGEAWRSQRKVAMDGSSDRNEQNSDRELAQQTATIQAPHTGEASKATEPRFRIGSLLSRFFSKD